MAGCEDAFMRYTLCKEFGIKPSEIDGEKWRDLQELLVIFGEAQEEEKRQQKSIKSSKRR